MLNQPHNPSDTYLQADNLWRNLQGINQQDVLAEIDLAGVDHMKKCLLGLAALLQFRDQINPFHEVMEEHISRGLKERGISFIPSKIYKELGIKFQPEETLKQSDLDFVDSLPDSFRRSLIFVPMAGDITFHSIVEKMAKLNDHWPREFHEQGRNADFINQTRSGDRWMIFSKKLAEGTTNRNLEEGSPKIPNGFKLPPTAELAVAVLLYGQLGFYANDFLRNSWARTGDGSVIVTRLTNAHIDIRNFDPNEKHICIGLGICKE